MKQKFGSLMKLAAILCACICIFQYSDHASYVLAAENTQQEGTTTQAVTENNTPESEATATTANTGVDMNLVFLIGTSVVTAGIMALAMSKNK